MAITMAGRDIVDLTLLESTTHSPISSVHARSIQRTKRTRPSVSTEGVTSPAIHISDREEEISPSVSAGSVKRHRSKKRKKRMASLEEGELSSDGETDKKDRCGVHHIGVTNDGSQSQTVLMNNSRFSINPPPTSRDSSPLFYLDDEPDKQIEGLLQPDYAKSIIVPNALLLPDHVMLDVPQSNGTRIVTEAATMLESETDDFIHYADAELNIFTRYYEEPKDDVDRKAHLVCGQCGAEGDHKQADCPVLVCLTCGAHNEHSTRQCPIVKTCFSCGMKGHINKDCPNRQFGRRLRDMDYVCTRCGSDLHITRECSTLWRMYDYMDDAEHEMTLKSRREKENLPIGQGGEGYIAEDYWCYNCGGEGHLGDDCEVEHRHPEAKEPSAFGLFNTMTGPFADHEFARLDRQKLRREWEGNGNFDDGHGFAGPSDVGKKGRDKERDRMRRREKETRENEDDNNDWFDNRLQVNTRSRLPQRNVKDKEANDKKMVIAFRGAGGANNNNRRPGDRLLNRMSSGFEGNDGEQGNDTRMRSDRKSSPRSTRDSAYIRVDRRSNRGGDRGREREHDRAEERHHQARADSCRPRKGDKRGNEDRPGRQYYGGYAR